MRNAPIGRPWALFAVSVTFAAMSLVLLAATWGQPAPGVWGLRGLQGVVAVSYAAVGAVVAWRKPENVIGWLLSAVGLFTAVQAVVTEYTRYALYAAPGVPGGALSAWVENWIWVPLVELSAVFIVLVFPDGRLLWRRLRVVGWLGAGSSLFAFVGLAFTPGAMISASFAENPFGVPGAQWLRYLFFGGILLFQAAALAAAGSLILRLRRSTGVERQQLKWFVYTAAPIPVLVGVSAVGVGSAEVLGMLAFGALPIAIGIAILRYRLYDIDLLINRTLVYSALTAMLALAYVGGIVLFQTLLRPLTSGSEIAVTASTLAVTLLFGPLRRRIQMGVDRRFYRRRYDAAATVDAFALRLRDSVDLDALTGELLAVVGDTVQPAHASVWLRERAR